MTRGIAQPGRTSVLGVVGTMVWDAIWRQSDVGPPVEEWGGISYSLAAADAIKPFDYKFRPVIKLGRDLADRGLRFLEELSSVETHEAVHIVDAMNPRVELRYTGDERRCERILGGVPPWTWPELAPLIEGCDALYLNFITGMELDLATVRQLRRSFEGPIYADIHYLTMAIGAGGVRRPRHLPRWSEWLSCFDVVQVNETELRVISGPERDPWAFAARTVGRDTGLLFVTLGSSGAVYFMAPNALPLEEGGRSRKSAGTLRTARLTVEPVAGGDPTGCGDVWGMTAYVSLLGGSDVEQAIVRANAAARRNVGHRGASGLSRYLRGGIERAGR